MKNLYIFSLLIALSSCSSKFLKQDPEVARDSIYFGKIKAVAVQEISQNDVCFDIKLKVKDFGERDVYTASWTLAFVDQNSRYHLMRLTQRNPASIPKLKGDEWHNRFRACAPQKKLNNFQYLLLTPKFSSPGLSGGLKLKWNS